MKWHSMIAAWTTLYDMIRGRWSRGSSAQKELILVAESNPALRRSLVDVLRDQHYLTIAACDGAEAVRIGARCKRQIHLLMTGARLPDLIGSELAELLRLDHPGVAVVYIAHDREEWWRLGNKKLKSVFLQVPFRPEAVLKVVRQGLNAHRELHSQLSLVGIQR
jgi:DNA-binding NtrC family response regulator